MCLTLRRGCAARAAGGLLLNRRALHRPERAENATVTWVRPKHRMATGAFIEEETRIGWHGLAGREAALRTCDDGLECRLRLHVVGPTEGLGDTIQRSLVRERRFALATAFR